MEEKQTKATTQIGRFISSFEVELKSARPVYTRRSNTAVGFLPFTKVRRTCRFPEEEDVPYPCGSFNSSSTCTKHQ